MQDSKYFILSDLKASSLSSIPNDFKSFPIIRSIGENCLRLLLNEFMDMVVKILVIMIHKIS